MTAQTQLPLCLWGTESGLDGRERKKKEESTRRLPPLTVNVGVPFPAPQARKWRILWKIFLSTPLCPTGFKTTSASMPGDTRERKNRKLTTSLVVLWILVSFSTLPATVYMSGSSESCSMPSIGVQWERKGGVCSFCLLQKWNLLLIAITTFYRLNSHNNQ